MSFGAMSGVENSLYEDYSRPYGENSVLRLKIQVRVLLCRHHDLNHR